jgi:hypothetical protein
VTKDKGVLSLSFGRGIPFVLMCIPHTAMVWLRIGGDDDPAFLPPEALQWLEKFEREIRTAAEMKARAEVIEELAQRKLRRILRGRPVPV